MADVLQLFDDARVQPGEASLVVLRTTRSIADIIPALRELAHPLEEHILDTVQPREPSK